MDNNTKSLTIDEIKKLDIDMLAFFDQLCKTNGIEYYLAYGSVLGAIRHNGIIPWDDDIDVMMTRDNYDKLQNVMLKQTHPIYELLYVHDKKYNLPLPKLIDKRTVWVQTNQRVNTDLGVYLDVFILDKLPESETKRARWMAYLDRIQSFWNASMYPVVYSNPLKKIACFLIRLVNPRIYVKWLDRVSKRYKAEKSDLFGVMIYSVYGRKKDNVHSTTLGTPQMVRFEGMDCPVPENSDLYLSNLYGDYMQLPPIEKRVSNHSYQAYWK